MTYLSGLGARPGSPGEVPTNWSVDVSTGLAAEVDAIGTEKGLPYFDVGVKGTAADAGFIRIFAARPFSAVSGVGIVVFVAVNIFGCTSSRRALPRGFAPHALPADRLNPRQRGQASKERTPVPFSSGRRQRAGSFAGSKPSAAPLMQ